MYVSLRYGRIFEREPLPVISFIPIEATADLSGANLCFEHPKDTAEDFLNQAETLTLKLVPDGRDRLLSSTEPFGVNELVAKLSDFQNPTTFAVQKTEMVAVW